jgi:hypothetical protein
MCKASARFDPDTPPECLRKFRVHVLIAVNFEQPHDLQAREKSSENMTGP